MMTVKELINRLKEIPEDENIYITKWDGDKLEDITSVSLSKVWEISGSYKETYTFNPGKNYIGETPINEKSVYIIG